MDLAEASVQWFKRVFGDDFYLELQLHKPTVENAAQDTYPKQKAVNERLVDLSTKFGVKIIASNDVHFVDEEQDRKSVV